MAELQSLGSYSKGGRLWIKKRRNKILILSWMSASRCALLRMSCLYADLP